MDIDTCLKMLREISVKIAQMENLRCSADEYEEQLSDFSRQFDALDAWLTRGGFLPDAWHRAKHSE